MSLAITIIIIIFYFIINIWIECESCENLSYIPKYFSDYFWLQWKKQNTHIITWLNYLLSSGGLDPRICSFSCFNFLFATKLLWHQWTCSALVQKNTFQYLLILPVNCFPFLQCQSSQELFTTAVFSFHTPNSLQSVVRLYPHQFFEIVLAINESLIFFTRN